MNFDAKIIKGNCNSDDRGNLFYNNDFDTSSIKRIYFIENKDTVFKRGWQGHKIEQRWFSAVYGSFRIITIAIDNWEKPTKTLPTKEFILKSSTFDVLCVPKGFVTSIQALEEQARLLTLSDYYIGEVIDEYRYDINYFK